MVPSCWKPAFRATEQDAGLAVEWRMVSRWNPTRKAHAISVVTAATATPRPRAAELTQYPISASPSSRFIGFSDTRPRR